MAVANNYYTCYRQLYRLQLVPVLFTPVHQFHLFLNPIATCPCNFFCNYSTLYLFKILENFYMLLGLYIDILHARRHSAYTYAGKRMFI